MCVCAYKYESPPLSLYLLSQPEKQKHRGKKKEKGSLRSMGVERGSGKGLKHMLKRCSSLGKKSNVGVNFNGVPKGHFVVYVGHSRSRHVIPISFLTHPIFQVYI